MRWIVSAVMVVVAGVMALDLAVGQPPVQFPGLTGGRGVPIFDPLTLLRNGGVRKELRMTEEQSGQLDDAMWKALAAVLSPEQIARLRQIELQQMQFLAFADPKVQAALKLTDEQKDDIATVMKDAEKVLKEAEKSGLLKGADNRITGNREDDGGAAAPGGDRLQAIKDDIMEKCTSTLSPPQKRLWLEMIGEEFKLQPGTFDFGKRGGKKKGG